MHIIVKNSLIHSRGGYLRPGDSRGNGLVLNMNHNKPITPLEKLPCVGDKLSDKCTNVVGGFVNQNSPQLNSIRTAMKSLSINPIETGGGTLLNRIKIPVLKDKLAKKENRNNIKFIL